MTPIIIAIAVIAIIALLVVRARQNKEGSGATAKAKKNNQQSAKSSKKEAEVAANVASEARAKPAIDLNNLLTQIDLLINDHEYAKAEGLINQSLKQDPSLHPLYDKLLKIHHAQDNDFAISQLLDTLQKLNLNETYQRIYNAHEAHKEEQSRLAALDPVAKSSGIIEYTPNQDNSSDFDSLTQTNSTPNADIPPQDNSLDFASLSIEPTVSSSETSLDFAPTPKSTAPESTPVVETEPTLEFKLDTIAPTTSTTEEPTLDFKLDINTPISEDKTSQSLDFNLETPSTPTSPSLDFNLETPTTPVKADTTSLNFSLDTPPVVAPETSSSLDFNLEPLDPTPLTIDPPTAETSQFVDINDPIVQSFSELAEINPIDLDIQLAEQYIRLGAFDTAKSLLQDQNNLSADQATKVEALLQKIA